MQIVHRKALLSADTSPEAERIQVERWCQMSSVEKVRAVAELSRAAQELALAGIRLRHPGASDWWPRPSRSVGSSTS
jgi:hypothetical protein